MLNDFEHGKTAVESYRNLCNAFEGKVNTNVRGGAKVLGVVTEVLKPTTW